MSVPFHKRVAPVIDLFPGMAHAPYHHETIGEQVEILAALGYERIYFVVVNYGLPGFSSPMFRPMPTDNLYGNHTLASMIAVGDANAMTAYEIKRRGLEAVAVYKPYEGGTGFCFGHGDKPRGSPHFLEELGGWTGPYDNLVMDHPDKRVVRRPEPEAEELNELTLERLELTFCLDAITHYHSPFPDSAFEMPPVDTATPHVPPPDLQVWVSEDNKRYRRLETAPHVACRSEARRIVDANGRPVHDAPRRCRIVDLSGFTLPASQRYLAVTFTRHERDDRLIPYSMIRGFHGDRELPLTCTCRRMGRPVDEHRKPLTPDFPDNGFAFDWWGSGFCGPGWRFDGRYGIARGKFTHMKGTPCEAYPEVRQRWLDTVQRLLAFGVDAVDIRIQNHSAMISDYANYGFNEPIVDAFRERHGVDIRSERFDPLDLMRVRGEFFMQFMREAASACHAEGRRFLAHFRHAFIEPKPSPDFGELGSWIMPKILPDWRGMLDLTDEVTIKDYNVGGYTPGRSGAIKEAASRAGKPVWVHCYIAQGDDLNAGFRDAVGADPRVDGILLYEVGHSKRADSKNVGMLYCDEDGRMHEHPPTIRRLRELGLAR